MQPHRKLVVPTGVHAPPFWQGLTVQASTASACWAGKTNDARASAMDSNAGMDFMVLTSIQVQLRKNLLSPLCNRHPAITGRKPQGFSPEGDSVHPFRISRAM